METKYGFHLMDITEFGDWLAAQHVSRVVKLIQNHHTYLPDYTHFTGSNHFERLKSMKNYHMVTNNWSNIAQTLTTFPDGKVAVCRPLNDVPIGIKGHNSKGICIEHFGNFDIGKDIPSSAHADTIVKLNAMLCHKFSLPVDTDHIVYHHWYDLNNGLRLNGKGSTKSCPGTAFFGGNKVENANATFIPLIQAALTAVGGRPAAVTVSAPVKSTDSGIVMASKVDVRKGAGTNFPVVSVLSAGSIVDIFESSPGWLRIGPNNEWVSDKLVTRVAKARVAANKLNIRSGPGPEFSALGSLSKDSEVMIYEKKGEWNRIDINEKWVAAKFLNFF
jgi:uncharacterized protein YraI